jgi:hypothetical protein
MFAEGGRKMLELLLDLFLRLIRVAELFQTLQRDRKTLSSRYALN